MYAIACVSLVSRLNGRAILQTNQASSWFTHDTVTAPQVRQAMNEIIGIVPPIINIKIPGLEEYLNTAPSARELMHVAMFSGSEPVFGPSGFNPEVILAQSQSYFINRYNMQFLRSKVPHELYWD